MPKNTRFKRYIGSKDLVDDLNDILANFRIQRLTFDNDVEREAVDFEQALSNAIAKGMTLQTVLHLKIGG